MTDGRERGSGRQMAESQLSELQNMRVLLEEARGLSRNLAYHRRAPGGQARRGPRGGGPSDSGVAGRQGLRSFPHSQRRTSRYIANTTETATVVHSSASTANGIARNAPFFAPAKPLAPFLCSPRPKRVHTPNDVSSELQKGTSG